MLAGRSGLNVIKILEAAFMRYGRPQHLRSDNGPEFIAYVIQDCLKEHRIKTIYTRLVMSLHATE